ncbi:deoxyribonuclease-1-like 1 [Pygocentrus nattereri]|uniref:Deoxyribonuclease n=1 Tax=Pygocentrus nattereri TaxID=42514 RepID=A0A3B4DZ16_PYGNA|nr:deoxyribonuclease-1-like 1 [Pygocentrus nattereri]
MTRPLMLLVLIHLCGLLGCYGFKICAFNVQSFGDSKAGDKNILHTLTQIVSRCDVCLLQEVRDHKKKAIPELLRSLNNFDRSHQYDYVSSGRLGRSQTYQEQYVFVFRRDAVRLKDQYQYPDTQKGDEDAFAREPFVVRIQAPKTVIGEFVLIPVHTSPTNATKEIDELYDVFEDVRQRWRTENMMFLGDFNAACGYVAKKNRKNIRLYTVSSFTWLIEDKQDTTVRESTDCAYDRIVVHGDHFLRAVVPFSARPFNFAREYHLTEEEALKVSDHYPIEVDLKTMSGSTRESTPPYLLPLTFGFILLLQLNAD